MKLQIEMMAICWKSNKGSGAKKVKLKKGGKKKLKGGQIKQLDDESPDLYRGHDTHGGA